MEKPFNVQLREARLESGLSFRQVGEVISKNYFSILARLETGVLNPPIRKKKVIEIGKALGMNEYQIHFLCMAAYVFHRDRVRREWGAKY